MLVEQVRIWGPANEGRVLLMAGQTDRYAIEPRGEYVFRRPVDDRRERVVGQAIA